MAVYIYEITLSNGQTISGAIKKCNDMNEALEKLKELEPDGEQATVRKVKDSTYSELQSFRARVKEAEPGI